MSDRTLDKHGLVEFNFLVFREAVRLLFEPSAPAQAQAQAQAGVAGQTGAVQASSASASKT